MSEPVDVLSVLSMCVGLSVLKHLYWFGSVFPFQEDLIDPDVLIKFEQNCFKIAAFKIMGSYSSEKKKTPVSWSFFLFVELTDGFDIFVCKVWGSLNQFSSRTIKWASL